MVVKPLHISGIGALLVFAIAFGMNCNWPLREESSVEQPSVVLAPERTMSDPKAASDPKAIAAAIAEDLPPGFFFEIGEGTPDMPASPLPPAPANPLDPKAAAALLARLPEIAVEDGDVVPFALRDASKPPPLTGETLTAAFPPPPVPDLPPEVESGPLTVLRYQPDGPVPLAPRITITFSQPMVPITSHDTLAKADIPARLSPDIEGNWRWVGARTLFFDPVGRAPMATDFAVDVPAGVKDATGRSLESGVNWTFHTPPPQLIASSPGGNSVDLEPVIWALFNQRVDPAAILEGTHVSAGGSPVALRLATDEERKGVTPAGRRLEEDLEGRWVAFRATKPFAPDTPVVVAFPKGLPSAEGPRTTETDQTFRFRTYGPMKFVRARCGWRDQCSPGQPLSIEFTNAIDEDHFEPSFITVEPPIQGMRTEAARNSITLRGMTKGKTTYTVTLSRDIKDVFGQRLDKEASHVWKVGPSQPFLFSSIEPMQVLDPAASRHRLPIHVMNMDVLQVELYRVTPADYRAYGIWRSQRNHHTDSKSPPPGKRVFSKRVQTKAPPEELTEVGIDLSPALKGGFGHVVAIVRPTGIKETWQRERMTVVTWLQVTQLGIDAFSDHEELHAWVTDLRTGDSAKGVEVTLAPGDLKGTTDALGLTSITLPDSGQHQSLIARRGQDTAFLPDGEPAWSQSSQWTSRVMGDQVRWFVIDDRALYRPDETVSIKGALRVIEGGKKGDVIGLPAGALTKLAYSIHDSRNNEIGAGTVDVSANGTFHLQYSIPKTPNLGSAGVRFNTNLTGYSGATYQHRFNIQEFRRPEFEVSALASQGPHLVGGSATASVRAGYYAGGPLPNAEVRWQVRSSSGSFTPPNHSDFVFGSWTPWWRTPDRSGAVQGTPPQNLTSRTDASGTHHLGLDFQSVSPPQATVINANATIMDVNRQAWSSSASFLVHPAEMYVGLRTDRYFVQADKPIEVEVVAVNLDGERLVGTEVQVQFVRLEWQRIKGKMEEVEMDAQQCVVLSAADPVMCTYMPKAGGRYRITAMGRDQVGRRNETSLSIWVPGGKMPSQRNLEMEEVTIIPSQRSFEVGETADLLVQSPFSPAQGVYLVRRDGIISRHAFSIEKDSVTIEVPIEEWMIPGFTVSVHLNGSAPRDLEGAGAESGDVSADDVPRRPAFATGQVALRVPPALRTLTVEATPAQAQVEPGGATEIAVTVKDHAGKPVKGAEVTLIVVDESILALSGYSLRDPVSTFYSSRSDSTRITQLRFSVLLAAMDEFLAEASDMLDDIQEEAESSFGYGGMDVDSAPPSPRQALRSAPSRRKSAAPMASPAPEEASGPIAVRSDFNPLALFMPDAKTDSSGRITVPVEMPDNLTRYRVMAVAMSGTQRFGTGESTITARLPLMMRLSPPRFLNFGDRFELPVVLQNQTDGELDVRVALRSVNAIVTEGAGRQVRVPPNDRVEVRFPMAADRPGTARFQAAASAGAWSDAAEVKLPVWTPATTEAFATYGEVDGDGVRQPVKLPEEVVPQFGGLEIQTSSTQLQALTDAVIYLIEYPFECSEQIASRVLSIAALRDVLTAFNATGMPNPEVVVAKVEADIERLRGMQANDGGFAFWRRDQPSWPFLTVHVVHALVRAKEKGFSVNQDMLNRGMRYLQAIRNHMNREHYTESVKRSIESYALYVRSRANPERDSHPDRARALIKEGGGLDKVSMNVVAWLYPVLSKAKESGYGEDVAAIRRHLNNRVTETAGRANFVTSFGDGAWLLLHSNRRIDGLLLEGLIEDQPQSDLIPKVVRGLLAHRQRGHWGSTQENAWVLLGLDRYFNVFESVTPDFLVRAWLGDQYAGEHRFKGRTTERHEIRIPMQQLADLGGEGDIVLARQGKGRMYYRLGMRYAPQSLELKPSNHGFHVERTYMAVDDPDDVQREEDGRWVVKAGARVKVQLTMHTDSRRYHVALVDPMPAGFEALTPELKGTEPTPPRDEDQARRGGRGRHWWWWRPWYEHENLRDERAEAFASLLWEGVYTYTYYARATTPGDFVVPPAKAEEMYAAETFGRSASERVTVR